MERDAGTALLWGGGGGEVGDGDRYDNTVGSERQCYLRNMSENINILNPMKIH